MSAQSDAGQRSALASVELRLPGSSQSGRAFVSAEQLRAYPVEELTSALGRCFVEEDDQSRLRLVEQALAESVVTVETYPGETGPVELHAYIRAPRVSDVPIFACVLASLAVVEHLVAMPPHIVLETATFQVVGEHLTNASIIAALETWIGRVWPDRAVPSIRLSPWPAPIEAQAALEILDRFAGVRSLEAGASAPNAFSPPDDLVAPEFRLSQDAA